MHKQSPLTVIGIHTAPYMNQCIHRLVCVWQDPNLMSCKLYLKRKMSAPTPKVQTTSRHRLKLEAWDARRGLPAPSSFETLSHAHTPGSARRVSFQL